MNVHSCRPYYWKLLKTDFTDAVFSRCLKIPMINFFLVSLILEITSGREKDLYQAVRSGNEGHLLSILRAYILAIAIVCAIFTEKLKQKLIVFPLWTVQSSVEVVTKRTPCYSI